MPRNPKRLQAALDRLEPALRSEVARAFEKLRRRVSIAAILDAIEQGNEVRLRSLTAGLTRDLASAADVVRKAFVLGSNSAVAVLPEGVTAALNLTSPFMVRAAEDSAARLVTGVTTETRKSINAVIRRAVAGELSGRDAGVLIRSLVGLTERQAAAVLTRRAKLIAQGLKANRVARDAARYSARLLKQRAEMIARTEIIRAASEGQVHTWLEAQRQGFLGPNARKRWVVTPDDRLCPQCAPKAGEIVPIHALFTDGVSGPPLHPQCRCALALVTQTAVGRRAA